MSGLTRDTPLPLPWAEYGPVDAPPLVVLHGGPGADHRYLLPQMLRLADGYRTLFYDQRREGERITWRTHVDDLGAVIRERLGPARPTIVGYSWGGLLALLYLIEATRALGTGDGLVVPARLVLIAPAPITRTYRAQFESEFARRQGAAAEARAALAGSGLRERDAGAYRQRAFELSVSGYFADPTRARDLTPFRVSGRVQQSVWESLGAYDLRTALLEVAAAHAAPATLVLHGRQDPIPLAASEALTAMLGAELVVLERCGHVAYVEQPEALFTAILAFLAASAAERSTGATREVA